MTLTAIESFCGAGGLSLGLTRAGFRNVLAFDNNEQAIKTFRSFVGPEAEVIDARAVTGADLLARAGLRKGQVDLFAGGPPCQGFSLQRRRGYDSDQRNDLVSDYFRLVADVRPRAFLLENVAMLGKLRGRKYIAFGFGHLHSIGYRIAFSEINSANYGVPQTRKRFIAVGLFRSGPFRFPPHTHDFNNWTTVKAAIADLPDCPDDYSEHPTIPNHLRARITERNRQMISHVPQGGGWRDIPRDLWLDCMKRWNGESGGWPDVYGRLEWGSQCPTITAGFDSFSRGRYAHPKWDRAITPREAARLQTFPDKVRFFGTRYDVRVQIGNAVPPMLAEALGRAIRAHLEERNVRTHPMATFPESTVFQPSKNQATLFAH